MSITGSSSLAYNAGWNARCKVDKYGAPTEITPNPFPEASTAAADWALGWDQADQDQEQEHTDRMKSKWTGFGGRFG